MKLMIYQSLRDDWALALIGDGEPTVMGYRKDIESAKDLASSIFKQPLNWRPRTGLRTFNDPEHGGIGFAEEKPMWMAFLNIS